MRNAAGYLALVTSEYQNSPKFLTMRSGVVQPFADSQTFLASIPTAFDIDVAIGVQLDIDGQWIGRNRQIAVDSPISYFSCDISGRGCNGPPLYVPGTPLTTTATVSLSDSSYRKLLYAKIAANNWNGTVSGAVASFQKYFTTPQLVFIEDQQNMTMQVNISGVMLTGTDLAIFSKDIPIKPMTVSNQFWVASAAAPIFGCDVENQYVSGCDVGAVAVTPTYIVLNT